MSAIERLRALAEADARLWARYGRGDYANDRDHIIGHTKYQQATESPTILALLDVVEAARDAVHAVGTSFWPVSCDRLRAALARLEGAL